MLKCTKAQAAKIIRDVSEGGVEPEWQEGIDKILAYCDGSPAEQFQNNSMFLANLSGLDLHACDMITNEIGMN